MLFRVADTPLHSVAFSADGSLVAAAASTCVILWNPQTAIFVATLPVPATWSSAVIWQLAFVPGTPFLAGWL